MASITLTKHHGLGNDFLIAVAPQAEIGPKDAIDWCDRRRGVGADGLIVASRHGEDPASWAMSLWNADGSSAELSGNGLRCLGQALVLHHDDGSDALTYRVLTGAGERGVSIQPDREADTDLVTVDMGTLTAGPEPWAGWHGAGVAIERQMGVDVGNPHLVAVVADPASVDLATIGPQVEGAYEAGINVELIAIGDDRATIELRVWERGAGITEACGTGACAAAWAARAWGLVDERVTVDMPGGSAVVELMGDSVSLSGPATFVAVVEIEQR